MQLRKGYTTVIRMGAAHNDMLLRGKGTELPPPVEPYHGRRPEKPHAQKARSYRENKRNATLSRLAQDLCRAHGIAGKRKRGHAEKAFRVVIEEAQGVTRTYSEARLAA